MWDKLNELWTEGTCRLEPLIRGFQEDGFMADLQQFVTERAPAFAVVCPDGSYPLVWTDYHNEYRCMFERQLNNTLCDLDLTQQELYEFCHWLRAHEEVFEDHSEGYFPFVEAATSSEEYDSFLKVMFAEVQRQQLEQAALDEVAQTQEIEVTVPDGVAPGEAIAVDYLGVRYELEVPEGCEPGMVFCAAVLVPT